MATRHEARADAPGTAPSRARIAALIAAGGALVVELAAPALVRAVPLGPLWVNALLIAGLWSLLLVLFEHRDRATGDRLLVLLVPFLAAGVLARLAYMDPGTSQAVVLRETAVPETVALAVGLALAWTVERVLPGQRAAWWGLAGLGALAAAALAGAHLVLARPWPTGAATVLALTLVAVATALVLQHRLARGRSRPRFAVLASGPALAVAGGQLLDGVVSYLAVVDPLDLLAGTASEGVFLSRALLSTAGPVFPLLKWALAAGAVVLVEPEGPGPDLDGDTGDGWTSRFALLVVVLFTGLGPGLFSALQVLGG